MRILLACEESQAVTKGLRSKTYKGIAESMANQLTK